jgi:DnaK suppressor protein
VKLGGNRSAKDLASWKKDLETLRKELSTKIRKDVGDIRSTSTKAACGTDDLKGDCEAEVPITLAVAEGETIKAIDAALLRIERGTYGTCSECEEPISEKRLKVLPFTEKCVDCQERQEQGLAETVDGRSYKKGTKTYIGGCI